MLVPELIGRYRVRRRLGSGAFATVWLADDDVLRAPVAVKVLAENWAHQLDIRDRFTEEARIMRRASSDRLVRVLDVGELPDGRPYLVMTYASGGTLAERLGAGPLSPPEALRVAAELSRGVAVLHELGVIHRDLKPSNVLFDGAGSGAGSGTATAGRVLVSDLGLAKALAHSSGFTVVAGSPGYMAPEQARLGGGLDERADVYALGALAYHMLTGRPPTLASSIGDVPSAAAAPVVRPSRARPGVPSRVDAVVLRALAVSPGKRWPSALAFADALDAVAAMPARPRTRLRRLLLAPLLVMAILFAGTASASAPPTGPRWVRVADAGGDLSVPVPAAWARQVRTAGWNPQTIRLPAGQAPGLLVGPDLAGYADPASAVPGVFVGASRALRTGTPALPDHSGCRRQPDRQLTVGRWTALVRRWTDCGGTPISFTETVLSSPVGYGIYVQVRQVDDVDHTEEILHGLRVGDALAPVA